jgi:hypothetical protein
MLKKWKTTTQKSGRRPEKNQKVTDDLKIKKIKKTPLNKWKTTSKSTKIALIGCDTIVKSPSQPS